MKKAIALVMLAAAIMGLSAVAQPMDNVGAIFESKDGGLSFPLDGSKDTNFDSIVVGDDVAKAFGNPFVRMDPQANAKNSLEIKKNQDTQCTCCPEECTDCCPVNNLEMIKVGNRFAFAVGDALASNDVKILTNQM